ncbi:MAG: RNA chaperone Hfq [Terriglobales bacterium]
MKETLDPIPAEHSTSDPTADQEGFANRKLIRPTLSRGNDGHNNHGHNHGSNHGPNHTPNHAPNHAPSHVANHASNHASSERREPRERSASPKKVAPSEQTNAENFYYQKQMQTKTPMVVVLRDGEEVHGYIEWYDKSCIKLNRSGAPNLMIYKPAIKYMFKEGEVRR